ncbi:class GN sortase [Kineobactrum salinum]|uniref:Class GN sortase n=1 Tax=Kineobactrum salinum TaxID=2708301 RepID=A0A6C0TXX8_9GAMM|nr:class GN sortase [Kineobactrum salinum]QIB64651.1 class GN sortase [Kineobactrum salinum]
MFPSSSRPALTLVLLALLASAGWQLSAAGWIHAKAVLAQRLLAHAWQASVHAGAPTKPWPWADTWPVAQLRVPARGVDQYVLSGISGQALAFGPGLHPVFDGSGSGSGNGWALVAGHRDTHFAFMQGLVAGDLVELQWYRGAYRQYRVTQARVVDTRLERLDLPPVTTPHLLLVTCYPFEAANPNGPLRYVVEARAVGSLSAQSGELQ